MKRLIKYGLGGLAIKKDTKMHDCKEIAQTYQQPLNPKP
jgi:hypothetical protein